jgi:TANFOR domain-containing protein
MLNPFTKIRYALPLMMLLFAGSFTARSQHYPVQVNTMITPPYSARLSDYVESGFDRVQVIINPLDMSLVSYKVKIKLIIESLDGRIRIQTDPNYLPPPLYLNGGVTEIITSYDVQSLFDANHLIFQKGITKNEYLVNKKLPENYYRIGFVLLDYNRSTMGGMANEVAVSNFGYTQAGIFLNDPPMLNMPLNAAKLTIFEPQQIVLQWTPRHRGSPNSAFSAEYVVKLYEVWNENYSAAAIVQTQMPIFENVTSDNRYIYGIADPMLIPGKKYVWTVQARDADGRDMFRNNGLSEAYMFTWGEACKLPAGITGAPVNGPGIELQWSTSAGHTDYDIQYRPAGSNVNWYEQNSLLTNANIYSLKYNTTYETRVRANCGTYSSEYTQPLTIKIPGEPERNFSCGAGNPLATITSTEPMTVLPAGIIFYAGGFRCEVIEAVPANGGFTGTCLVEVPFYGFAKVLHTFKGIRISNDLQMFSGKLVSVTDTAKNSALMQRIDEATQPAGSGLNNEQLAQNLNADTTIVVDGRIRTIEVNGQGEIVVTLRNGDTEIIEVEEGKKVIISDKDGEQYVVENGKVVKADDALAAKAAAASTPQQVANIDSVKALLPLVHFAPSENMQYGFDSLRYPALRGQYTINTVHDATYVLPYKAVATGASDMIDARLPRAGGFDAAALSFKINEVPVMAMPATRNNSRTVNVTPLMRGDEQVLEAVYTLTDTAGKKVSETLGALNVVAYDEQNIKLIIVPVGTSGNYIQGSINDQINKIYSQSVTQWDIVWMQPFENTTWDINGDEVFDDTDADDRMDYAPEMKALIKSYKDAQPADLEKQAVYVFLISGSHMSDLKGYMPFNKQFAFVFTKGMNDAGAIAHNISHEIAHGTFNLRHTFSPENTWFQSEGTTDNLMDYSHEPKPNNLNKYQWDLIHNPASALFSWLEDEGEGESQLWSDPVCVQKFLELYRYCYVKQQKLVFPQDGYPYFGHFAKNLKLLDGNTYEKVHVTVRQDLGTVPIKLTSQMQGGINTYFWGKVLEIFNNNKNPEFLNYLYPPADVWDKQMTLIASQIAAATTIKDALNLLSAMPLSEYNRLSFSAISKSIEFLSSKFLMTEDYIGCINDEEIIIALIKSCENNFEKKKALLLALSKGNTLNRFVAHLDGENLKKFVIDVAKYTNEVLPPNMHEITQDRFNSMGAIYSHLFDWKETLGPDVIFESDNAVLSGDFVITTKNDWMAIFQDAQYLMRIEPFEYIGIMADDAIAYLPELVKPKETIVMMPAFLFHWLLTQKEREQTMKDFSTMLDLGISVVTFGSYAAGKAITKVSIKSAEGMIVDFGIQAFINLLDGSSIQDAVNQVDYSNVFWSGASVNIDNSRVSMALGCVRAAYKGITSSSNTSMKQALIAGGGKCFEDLFLSMVSKGIVKVGDEIGEKYFILLREKIEVSPEFITKRLLKYGLNKYFILSLSDNSKINYQINKAINEYEQGETE